MKIRRVHRKIAKSPGELARIQALREKYKSRPAPEKLLASGDYSAPVPLGVYLKIKQLMHQLKQARAKARLSLADLAERTEIDRGYLSKLENMQQANTTLETASRIAEALGLEIRLTRVTNGRKAGAKQAS
ncbi:MAG: helix-turn-helix transcriptional regulator [Gemmataceae bacterium]|nr:helix-turn-helix transcriptional regulator [Gemmataceae bacterium]